MDLYSRSGIEQWLKNDNRGYFCCYLYLREQLKWGKSLYD